MPPPRAAVCLAAARTGIAPGSPSASARRVPVWRLGLLLLVAFVPTPLLAQPVEMVGSRALGMGGAFVAVANDSSATWWNPAGLAAGPFLDVALTRGTFDGSDQRQPARGGTWGFSVGTPPFGLS
jgi:hypothetical protein